MVDPVLGSFADEFWSFTPEILNMLLLKEERKQHLQLLDILSCCEKIAGRSREKVMSTAASANETIRMYVT